MKKWALRIFLFFLLPTLMIGLNNQLTLTEYEISNSRIPEGFDGYRIAVVSDLHAKRFGDQQQELIHMLQNSGCDLICILGDAVSKDTVDFSPLWEFVDGMSGTPMVYVAGNNELALKNYDEFLAGLVDRGVAVLDDMGETTLQVEHGADSILIHGHPFRDSRQLSRHIEIAEKGFFNVLLYHDPYCFPEVALFDYDLMLSGHTHGGVVRFPLVGSPMEWIAKEPYTKGIYTSRAATLIVSGGLGSHEILPRFFNSPEIVLITLCASGNA